MEATTINTFYLLPPSPYGEHHNLARICIFLFNIILLICQLIFLKGAWSLMGWNSNFSFTVLIAMALSASQSLIVECVAVALSDVDTEAWKSAQYMWRLLGSLFCVPNATTIVLSFILTAHRFIYTAFPFSGDRIFTPVLAKILLLLVLISHLFFCFATTTDIGYYRYVPNFLANSIKAGTWLTNVYLQLSAKSDWIIVINPIFYLIIFGILFCNKNYKIRKGSEIRMTLQALLIMVTEFGCFLYWSTADAQVTDDWLLFLTRTLSTSIYLSCSSIIYLIFNQKVRRNAFSLKTRNLGVASVSLPSRPTFPTGIVNRLTVV